MQKNYNNGNTILIADSCAGGIAVLQHFLQWSKNSKFFFLADGEKNPFGLKSQRDICLIVEDWLKFATTIQANCLVVACNTASIAIHSQIRNLSSEYGIPIITMIDAMTLALKHNHNLIYNRDVVLMGTKFTVSSEIYKCLIERHHPKNLATIDGTNSERIVARGLINSSLGAESIYQNLNDYREKPINTFVLGCTCFEFIKPHIKCCFGQNVDFINPCSFVAESVKPLLLSHSYYDNADLKSVLFVTTGDLDVWNQNINAITNILFGVDVNTSYVKLR